MKKSSQGQYISLDLEFNDKEIVQISATRMISQNYGRNIEIGDSFDSYIKPKKALKEDFKDLTGISEKDVQDAPDFITAMKAFEEWMSAPEVNPIFILTWGNRDEKILHSNLASHNYKLTKNYTFLDVQAYIMMSRNLKKLPSLESQVTHDLHDFKGAAHNSLNDAQNMANLFKHILEERVFMK